MLAKPAGTAGTTATGSRTPAAAATGIKAIAELLLAIASLPLAMLVLGLFLDLFG